MPTFSDPFSIPQGCDHQDLPFAVHHIANVSPAQPEKQWLIEQLWQKSCVGILGGHAKVCKTYLACELSLAVASGTQALARFPVKEKGPVLFFGAEDSLQNLKSRFEGLALARKLCLDELPIFLLDTPALKLDYPPHLQKLHQVIDQCKPALLVLDPFVRMLGAADENSASDISSVLASLRQIQRAFNLAVLVVHHARKSPAAHPGQALRGSSDFAAWSDSNFFIIRQKQHLSLLIEHRNAKAPEPLKLRLCTDPAPHLSILDDPSTPGHLASEPLHAEILNQLESVSRPLPTVQLQRSLHRRKATLVEALNLLEQRGFVSRTAQGWIRNNDSIPANQTVPLFPG